MCVEDFITAVLKTNIGKGFVIKTVDL